MTDSFDPDCWVRKDLCDDCQRDLNAELRKAEWQVYRREDADQIGPAGIREIANGIVEDGIAHHGKPCLLMDSRTGCGDETVALCWDCLSRRVEFFRRQIDAL